MRTLTILVFCWSLIGLCNADSTKVILPTPAPTSSPLAAQYLELKEKLANSIFGSPILLNSQTGNRHAQGEVYALLDTSFTELRNALSQPAHWCELAILHVNIKTCIYLKDQVQLFVGRKHYQTPDDAFALKYQFTQQTNDQHQLIVKLSAPDGPFGTSDYHISLEATPIDEQHSFIRFQYRYRFGFLAKMAMKTYLATLGRKKVGFTIVGADKTGEPIFIKGLQGIIERNVMRYIFAIQSILDARKSPLEYRPTAQLMSWYAHTQEHPRQLVELTREQYMRNKKRERRNQREAQKALLP